MQILSFSVDLNGKISTRGREMSADTSHKNNILWS